jgi:hypothetical protein
MAHRSVALLDLDDRTIEMWRDAGIVFLVGSFVSTFAPTNLPTGIATTKALWNRILRSSDQDCLGKDFADLEHVPFEAIMQCYPKQSAVKPIIQKLYCEAGPNEVHRRLVSSLQSGTAKGLITTNYDLAFDSVLQGNPDVITIVDDLGLASFRTATSRLAAPPSVFFKIHGTAAVGYSNTIVCDLNAEGWLKPWKRELLREMVYGRALILIGYSGSDFDLCPELAEFTKQAHTVWLQHKPGQARPNSRRVLDRTGGIAVIGDLVEFLERILNEKIKLPTSETREVDLSVFDTTLTDEWRVNLLSWIACPSLLLRSIKDLTSCESSLRLAVYAHSGRYGDAVCELERESQSPKSSVEQGFRRRIHLAGAKFIYGQHLRGWRMLNEVSKELSADSASEDLRTLVIEVRMMMYMRGAQIARALRLDRLLVHIQKVADSLYSEALTTLQQLGEWGRLEALQQNAERIGVARSDALPLPTRSGYNSLGLISMHAIVERDWIRSGSWRLTSEQERRALRNQEQATRYGWHHEAWKLSWILLFRGHSKKWLHLRIWNQHFWATQYPPFSRLFQLFINLVPTWNSGAFEDENYWR